ncbi:MAG TPA: hypothetical protein VGM02_02275 [Acidobacteriaceae bacterium]
MRPFRAPASNALLAPLIRALSNDVVSNFQPDRQGNGRNIVDTGDLELRNIDARELRKPCLDLVEESIAPANDIGRKSSSQDFDSVSAAQCDFLCGH